VSRHDSGGKADFYLDACLQIESVEAELETCSCVREGTGRIRHVEVARGEACSRSRSLGHGLTAQYRIIVEFCGIYSILCFPHDIPSVEMESRKRTKGPSRTLASASLFDSLAKRF
jgi:hypothetical protein